MPVVPVESSHEFDKIITSGKVVVFDFWAQWCGPCRQISPIFEQLSNETNNVEFYKVNVDEQSEVSKRLGIRAIPTFIAFKDGEPLNTLRGADPQGLKTFIKTYAPTA